MIALLNAAATPFLLSFNKSGFTIADKIVTEKANNITTLTSTYMFALNC